MIKLILVLIVSCISLSGACRFIRRPDEQIYCDSGFAGIITIATDGFPCGNDDFYICYGINDFQQIRGDDDITPYILRTSTSSAACGVSDLERDRTYFVAASVVDSYVIEIFTFDLYDDWTDLSESEVETETAAYLETVCPYVAPLPIEISPIKTSR